MFRAWNNSDPPVQRNCALTPKHQRFLHQYANDSGNKLCQALSTLVIGAFFFACRSCEYLKVVVRGKTKILRLRNIIFTTDDYQTIHHTDIQLEQKSFYVSITFEDQKNNMKNETRSQQRNNDPVLCPVRAWAQTVTRILSYPSQGPDSTVNVFMSQAGNKSSIQYLSQNTLNIYLRATIQMKSPNYFGYSHNSIGTHSVRSGAAMALYLGDTHPHKIMLLGRWSSDAFLVYLRPQVLSSFAQLSTHMLQNEDFRSSGHQLQNDRIHPDDPLRPGDSRSIISSRRHSFYGAEKAANTTSTRFHLFH
jgi:hypothetical protein